MNWLGCASPKGCGAIGAAEFLLTGAACVLYHDGLGPASMYVQCTFLQKIV
jgi:hypothetical protein